jgi:hypothetical protein
VRARPFVAGDAGARKCCSGGLDPVPLTAAGRSASDTACGGAVDRDRDKSAGVEPAIDRSMHTGIIHAIPGSTLARLTATDRKALKDNQNAHTTTAIVMSMLAQNAKLLVRTRASTPTEWVAPSKANGGANAANAATTTAGPEAFHTACVTLPATEADDDNINAVQKNRTARRSSATKEPSPPPDFDATALNSLLTPDISLGDKRRSCRVSFI